MYSLIKIGQSQLYKKNLKVVPRKILSFFWNYVYKLYTSNYIHEELFLKKNKVCNTNDICNLFAMFFKSVHDNNQAPALIYQLYLAEVSDVMISIDDVVSTINKLKNKS